MSKPAIVVYYLDVLKPHNPSNSMLAFSLAQIPGVKSVNLKTDEIDQKTTSIYLTIKGNGNMAMEDIIRTLEENNCALHSVDRVYVENPD